MRTLPGYYSNSPRRYKVTNLHFMFWHIKGVPENSKVYFKKRNGKSQNSWDFCNLFQSLMFREKKNLWKPRCKMLFLHNFSHKLKIMLIFISEKSCWFSSNTEVTTTFFSISKCQYEAIAVPLQCHFRR